MPQTENDGGKEACEQLEKPFRAERRRFSESTAHLMEEHNKLQVHLPSPPNDLSREKRFLSELRYSINFIH